MYRDAFKPGDKVTPGVYWVHHYQHRLAHVNSVTLERFPECRVCGNKVRFSAAETVVDAARPSLLRSDIDFLENSRGIPIQIEETAD